MQKKELKILDTRVKGLLDRFKDTDPEAYVRMQAEFQQVNVKLSEKDEQLKEIQKLVSEKQEAIIQLEHDLERSKVELHERKSKINNYVQTESLLKTELDRQKRLLYQLKRRNDILVKEMENTLKNNQELSKELVDSNQVKRSNTDSLGEQAEKDARIQMLEKTVEKLKEESREKHTRTQLLEITVDKLREDVKKAKEEVMIEKAKNQTTDNDKLKLADSLEKHFEQVNQVSNEFGVVTTMDTLPVELGALPHAATSKMVTATIASLVPPAQNIENIAKPQVASKPKVEPRKLARRLVQLRIVKPEQPKGDVDISDAIDDNV